MSNRNAPWWIHKERREKARQQLAFSNRGPKKSRGSYRKEANVLRLNDPLRRLNRGLAIGKPRPGHRPIVPDLGKPVFEMKPWTNPYLTGSRTPEYLGPYAILPQSPLFRRTPEYLNPNSVLPQNPMFRRMPDAPNHY